MIGARRRRGEGRGDNINHSLLFLWEKLRHLGKYGKIMHTNFSSSLWLGSFSSFSQSKARWQIFVHKFSISLEGPKCLNFTHTKSRLCDVHWYVNWKFWSSPSLLWPVAVVAPPLDAGDGLRQQLGEDGHEGEDGGPGHELGDLVNTLVHCLELLLLGVKLPVCVQQYYTSSSLTMIGG